MYASVILAFTGLVASVAAAPAPAPGWTDPTVCASGTGYYQVCASGFKGCCTTDACSVGYCPTTTDHGHHEEPAPAPVPAPIPAPAAPGTCAPGTGYYQVCSSGFKGCCAQDACSIGYCPTTSSSPKERRREAAAAEASVVVPRVASWSDPTVCAAGTGYYQVCASGFKGCCARDACGLGYCPSSSTTVPPPAVPKTPEVPAAAAAPGTCAAGTGYYQVCASGFKGCCSKDACGLGYCPL